MRVQWNRLLSAPADTFKSPRRQQLVERPLAAINPRTRSSNINDNLFCKKISHLIDLILEQTDVQHERCASFEASTYALFYYIRGQATQKCTSPSEPYVFLCRLPLNICQSNAVETSVTPTSRTRREKTWKGRWPRVLSNGSAPPS